MSCQWGSHDAALKGHLLKADGSWFGDQWSSTGLLIRMKYCESSREEKLWNYQCWMQAVKVEIDPLAEQKRCPQP